MVYAIKLVWKVKADATPWTDTFLHEWVRYLSNIELNYRSPSILTARSCIRHPPPEHRRAAD